MILPWIKEIYHFAPKVSFKLVGILLWNKRAQLTLAKLINYLTTP